MVTICSLTKAQIVEHDVNSRLESLERLTKDLKESNKYLNENNQILTSNLIKYQKQRKKGIECIATGFALSGLGFLANTNSESLGNFLFISGGTSSLIGTIILLDSGKWITLNKRKKGNYIDIEYSK